MTVWIGFVALMAAAAGTDTLDRVVPLPVVEVSTSRSSPRAPTARTVLERREIAQRNWGQDTPMALATLPGAYAYSDAGNGIGYSYLSIRGFPQRRISVLVNGVPLNDPESHEVYWIDHPDLLASTREVQLQRGVGSALYGAASVGGSVNLETAPFAEAPSSSITLASGSYDTKRLMIESQSGRLAGDTWLYGRYSRIETLGYRDQSWSKLWSYAFSAQRDAGAHQLRANLYGGPEETHLAYLGVPRPVLDGGLTGDRERDRRFNPIAYPNERDHFFEPHYELIHTWRAAERVTVTQTLFWFDGKGYYDEQRFGRALADYRLAPWTTSDTTLFAHSSYRDANGDGAIDLDGSGRAIVERADLVRRRTVVNRHFGWVPRVRIFHGPGSTLTLGGELRAHDGRHYGEVISGEGLTPGTPPNAAYYDYHPRTLSAGLFLHEETYLPKGGWIPTDRLTLTADLGWRHQSYSMRDDHFDGIHFDQSYDFALPRLGLHWSNGRTDLYGSWAYSRREPAFRDLYDAEGVGSVPLFVDGEPRIRPESVNDWELGARTDRGPFDLRANLFRMDFRDELVYAGQFDTDLGYPILGNAARSVHQGVELAGAAWIGRRPGAASTRERSGAGADRRAALRLDANATLSDNHFVEYREVYGATPADVVRYDGNAIGFFPAVLANLSARAGLRGAEVGAALQYAGRIYLDNTERAEASIDPRTIVNLDAGYGFAAGSGARARLGLRVMNAFDTEYEAGGYMDVGPADAYVPYFIPAAGRSFLAELRMDW